MSTKIYNAFIFSGNAEELMTILKEIKVEYTELMKLKLSKLNYKMDWKLEQKRYPFLPCDTTIKELIEKHNEKKSPEYFKKVLAKEHVSTMLDFPDFVLADIIEREKVIGEYHPFNIDASAVVYFCEDKIFVQFFGLDRDYEKIIFARYTQFKDYHYQNSTDMSNYDWDAEPWDKMTEERQEELNKEWTDRRRIWDKIMPGYDAPSECGLVFEFTPNHNKLSLFCNEVLDAIKL